MATSELIAGLYHTRVSGDDGPHLDRSSLKVGFSTGPIKEDWHGMGLAEAMFRDRGMDWWTKQAVELRGRIDQGEPFKWFAPYVDGPPTT